MKHDKPVQGRRNLTLQSPKDFAFPIWRNFHIEIGPIVFFVQDLGMILGGNEATKSRFFSAVIPERHYRRPSKEEAIHPGQFRHHERVQVVLNSAFR